jgi:hypothetical protein
MLQEAQEQGDGYTVECDSIGRFVTRCGQSASSHRAIFLLCFFLYRPQELPQ